MADDQHPSSLQAGQTHGEPPDRRSAAGDYHPSHLQAGLSELAMFLRWSAGLFLLIFAGWGFIILSAYLLNARLNVSFETAAGLGGLMSLGLLLLLERKFWLSRFMGLRYNPESPAWVSAVFLWLLGVPGLLFRSTADASAATATQAAPASPGHKPQSPGMEAQPNSLREILETVVFVVVLVLLLKSFSAEAFVIPTGSMATTLWGYQKDVICPQCGYSFPINCSDEAEKKPPTYIAGGTCPNCRYQIDFSKERMNPSCSTGDRVLVAKYFYDSGLVKPHRLDVVVFKYPQEPQKQHVAMNYIKRLIGLPGETIGIYYGKLYVLSADIGPQYPKDLEEIPDIKRWEQINTHPNEANHLLQDPNTRFQIVRKPPEKILAMRRIVFDNDFQPRDLKGIAPPRWDDEDAASPSWAADGPTGFRHPARGTERMEWLRYRHILRLGHEPELITDFMGYNSKAFQNNWRSTVEHPALARNWVGDLILECDATVEEPTGELALELSKGVDRFQARWDLASGTCSLWRRTPRQEIKLESAATPVQKKGTYRLRFANVDERLTVWVDDKLVFGDGVIYEAPSNRKPSGANDLQPASIGVRGAAVRIQKLKLWRDTYYTVTVSPSSADAPGLREIYTSGMSDADKEKKFHELLSSPDRWFDAFGDMPCTTMYVQPDHYLCLGDNSPESSDGRSWGLVPNRLMLGRALLVYWPLSLFGKNNRGGPIR
jgi:signal peptidase I